VVCCKCILTLCQLKQTVPLETIVAKKKFYAIARGRKPGIYDNWPLAEAQVKGFAGAVYKGFETRREAQAFLKNPVCRRSPAGKKATPGKSRPPGKAQKHPAAPSDIPSQKDVPRSEAVTIYTDGGSINNPGPGGYGVVQLYNGRRKELSGGFRLTTNNRMVLMACIVALRELEYRNLPVTVHSDSSYVVNGISRGWARGWRKRGWLKSDKTPALNPDLWGELLDLVETLDVTFKWVRGHAGNPLNERCDELANGTARQEGLPADEVYERQVRQRIMP